ncbi:MAG: extracellular solute-binding protein [Burkholderiaceae bacterium]
MAPAAWAVHGMALGDEPKYPADFTHFDYVNPDAPRGGEVTLSSMGNYDKLNPFTLKGRPPRMLSELMFETLTEQSLDEPFSVYGLLAEDMSLAPDGRSITFRLRPQARFSNGDPVTADDVKYSFDTLRSKAASPMYRQYWQDVRRAVVVDRLTVRFDFERPNRELHMIVGALPVFSKKWGQGKPFDQVVNDEPIASGPYRIDYYDLGKSIGYKRDPDYWGKDLAVRRGMYNFDKIHITYFLDEFARIEGFKAGVFDFVYENAAKNWARAYYGAKFDNGQLIKTELPNSNAQGMQGYMFNTRRPIFQDVRVRKALGLALDFEWMNRQLFYDQYSRSDSFFTNSELAATGMPSDEELALLEPYRSRLPAEVFEEARKPPVTAPPPNSLRNNLREARQLLAQAGWTYRDGALRNASGEPFEFEIIDDKRTWERVVAPFGRALDKLGIQMRFRVMDSSLLKAREDQFDYDMVINWWLSSQSPGNELTFRVASASADEPGSDNFPGIHDPIVDKLVEAVLSARSRHELVTACRALDRVLRAGYYVIPQWYNKVHRVSYKNRFGRPRTLPLYYQAEEWFVQAWWMLPDAKH